MPVMAAALIKTARSAKEVCVNKHGLGFSRQSVINNILFAAQARIGGNTIENYLFFLQRYIIQSGYLLAGSVDRLLDMYYNFTINIMRGTIV